MTSGKGAEDIYGSFRTAFASDYNCPVMSILISTPFAELSILLRGKKCSSQIKYFEMGSSFFFFPPENCFVFKSRDVSTFF